MAPTICSGKKRQTRTIATTEIRRHGQRSQLNQALSNIVNYVAKGPTNPRVSASLRIQTHNPAENNTTGNQHQHHNANNDASTNSTNNNNNHSHKHSIQTSATLAANHRRQQFSSISDNAVTSSTHSDTENSYDLRLTNETLVNNGSTTTNSSNINSSSSLTFPSTSSSSSHKEMSSPLCEERRFQRYSSSAATTSSSSVSHVQANDLNDENDVTEDNNNYSALNAETNKKHSKHFFKYSDDDDEDMMNGDDDVDSTYASDTDSMTSLDTEKSAELKRGNHPQWRDKYCTKSLTNASNSNTDGLLSIAIKTIKLVKRNQLLQQRLTQLQLETTEFIESVLANPENRHFRENIKQKVKEVENV